ncbi:hypothetical protein J2W39_000075 [Variovorax paradoxus]|uniref:Uncharacterized protein n=1 Tax=Variovorax paradoxus TaxID=34073 RepID=A0AAW8E8I1_VARPD|nr:hypothetical protein [Variovorax paradoxus]MDP9968852.1 hypothetical protein [Variovorax paradoxus]
MKRVDSDVRDGQADDAHQAMFHRPALEGSGQPGLLSKLFDHALHELAAKRCVICAPSCVSKSNSMT